MPIKRKARVNRRECVACGCCAVVCPKKAISIEHGVYADVDETKCVGCSRCALECPASAIHMEVMSHEA